MLLRKVNSVLLAILLIFILSNLSSEASSLQENSETAITNKSIQSTNLHSRTSLQFQFQAYTNIYSEFDVKTQTQSLIRPFQGLVKLSHPLSNISLLTDNKELELCSIWAKNKIIQHLLPYHGFS